MGRLRYSMSARKLENHYVCMLLLKIFLALAVSSDHKAFKDCYYLIPPTLHIYNSAYVSARATNSGDTVVQSP